MFEQLYPLITIVVVFIIFAEVLKILPGRTPGKDKIAFQHYYLVNSLHSRAELAFDKVLHARLGDTYRICPKVRLSDIAKVRRRGVDSKIAYGLRRRCDPRHADWIITNSDGIPLSWIELDDRSHNSQKAKKADKFKNDLAKAIGIPLTRFRVGENYHLALNKLPIDIM